MTSETVAVLYDYSTIQERIAELADALNNDYAGEEVVLLCVLKGAVHFFSDLAIKLTFKTQYKFVGLSSYEGTESTRDVKVTMPFSADLEGKHVLIVEDIVDTGHSMTFLMSFVSAQKPKSINICTLLSKPSRREVTVDPEYIAFEIEDKFVIGYGLDLDQRYRNLPYIGVFNPSA
jgi:hypoxanthine phosphoribosyltransferase